MLTEAPILIVGDPEKEYTVTTDASDTAISAVLSQDDRPVEFLSKKLNPAEKNYPTHDKEFLAIVAALKEWKHYLQGALPFKVYTDHHSLKYVHKQPSLNPRQARWMETLAEYPATIIYQPGKINVVADALSRLSEPTIQEIVKVETTLIQQIQQAYLKDYRCSRNPRKDEDRPRSS